MPKPAPGRAPARILWLSRHPPLPAQRRELDRLWPGCTIDQKVHPYRDAAEIVRRVRDDGYDQVVAVAPLSVLDQLCRRGLFPLRAEMEPVPKVGPCDPDWEVDYGGRRVRFREFRRVTRLHLETEALTHGEPI